LKSWIQPRRKLARIMILGHGTCITASPSPDPRCADIFITEFLSYFNTSRYMPKYRVRCTCQGIMLWDTRAEPKIHSITPDRGALPTITTKDTLFENCRLQKNPYFQGSSTEEPPP
jgi:hypothetical protein